jgi:hypothetical protein
MVLRRTPGGKKRTGMMAVYCSNTVLVVAFTMCVVCRSVARTGSTAPFSAWTVLYGLTAHIVLGGVCARQTNLPAHSPTC